MVSVGRAFLPVPGGWSARKSHPPRRWVSSECGKRFDEMQAPVRRHAPVWDTVAMAKSQARHRKRGFLGHHSLSIASVAVVLLWIVLYSRADPHTHVGSFFGNAVADWTGVLVTVVATKYFYELGSAESRQPHANPLRSRLRNFVVNHSLTIFLALTGIAWVWLFARVDSESKWGQVV